jgi:hypothetical protein
LLQLCQVFATATTDPVAENKRGGWPGRSLRRPGDDGPTVAVRALSVRGETFGRAPGRRRLRPGHPSAIVGAVPEAPPSPLAEVWIAVNRFGLSGEVRGPGERVSVEEAMRMVTTDAAYTLGVEDKVGSIVAGKFADFTVIERDPFEVPKEAPRDIPIWGTVLGGKIFPANEIRQR